LLESKCFFHSRFNSHCLVWAPSLYLKELTSPLLYSLLDEIIPPGVPPFRWRFVPYGCFLHPFTDPKWHVWPSLHPLLGFSIPCIMTGLSSLNHIRMTLWFLSFLASMLSFPFPTPHPQFLPSASLIAHSPYTIKHRVSISLASRLVFPSSWKALPEVVF